MSAHDLQVVDQMSGAIGNAREIGMAPARAALVDQEHMISCRIEQGAVYELRSAAWSAMQEDDRAPAFAADLFNVNPMPVANVEHARIERSESFGECSHRLPAEHEIRGPASDGCATTAHALSGGGSDLVTE
jgi:hypothetical protein